MNIHEIFQCEHCGNSFSSLASRRQHMIQKLPKQYINYLEELRMKGDKRVRLLPSQLTPQPSAKNLSGSPATPASTVTLGTFYCLMTKLVGILCSFNEEWK